MSRASVPEWPWFFSESQNPVRPIDRDRLTFGVEMEFALAVFPAYSRDDPDEDDRGRTGRIYPAVNSDGKPDKPWLSARQHIVRTFRKNGIAAQLSTDKIVPKTWKPNNPMAWGVKEDDTIRVQGDEYAYIPIEIVSPPFYFAHEAVAEVKYVCYLLSSKYRLTCNETCAFQVHVGNGPKGFDYRVAQNFLATYFTFEPQIEQIHPPHRRDNPNCPEIRKSSVMTRSFNGRVRSVREGLARIFKRSKGTMKELLEDTSPEVKWYGEVRRSAVTIKELLSFDDKKTVEFRQHEMTLDPIRVENWTRVCVGLVEFSDTVGRESLEGLLNTVIGENVNNLSLWEVLRTVGLPHEADYYSTRTFKSS